MTDTLQPDPSASPAAAPVAAAPLAAAPPAAAPLAPAAAVTFAPGLAPSNVPAILGFVLALAGVLIPVGLLTLAGGIISIVGLRRAGFLANAGVPATGRGFAIAGIIVGFGMTVLAIVGLILVIAGLASLASQLSNLNPGDLGNLGNLGG